MTAGNQKFTWLWKSSHPNFINLFCIQYYSYAYLKLIYGIQILVLLILFYFHHIFLSSIKGILNMIWWQIITDVKTSQKLLLIGNVLCTNRCKIGVHIHVAIFWEVIILTITVNHVCLVLWLFAHTLNILSILSFSNLVKQISIGSCLRPWCFVNNLHYMFTGG